MAFQKYATALGVGLAIFLFCETNVRADVLESWDNTSDATFDGWGIPPSYSTPNATNFSASYSTTTGVTNGTAAVAIASTPANDSSASPSGPSYGQMLASPFKQNWTTILAHAAGIQFDVFTPNPSFGYYLQFDADLNNADAGFQSIYSYNYLATNIGSETTLKYYFSPPAAYESVFGDPTYGNIIAANATYQAKLAQSTNPTQIVIQVGGGYSAPNQNGNPANSETMYIDNLQAFYQQGDFNFDHHVDSSDILAMENALTNLSGYEATNFLTNNDMLQIGDFNGDGVVNNADLQGLINLLLGGGGSVAAVPEPQSWLLLGLAVPALVTMVRRRRAKSIA